MTAIISTGIQTCLSHFSIPTVIHSPSQPPVSTEKKPTKTKARVVSLSTRREWPLQSHLCSQWAAVLWESIETQVHPRPQIELKSASCWLKILRKWSVYSIAPRSTWLLLQYFIFIIVRLDHKMAYSCYIWSRAAPSSLLKRDRIQNRFQKSWRKFFCVCSEDVNNSNLLRSVSIWMMFKSAPFFSSACSDLYKLDTLCHIHRVESRSYSPY